MSEAGGAETNDEEHAMTKPTPFLWFDDEAEEAMSFYVSIFPRSKVLSVTRYGADAAPVGRRTAQALAPLPAGR